MRLRLFPSFGVASLLIVSVTLPHWAAGGEPLRGQPNPDPANPPFTKIGQVTGAAEDCPLGRAFPTLDGSTLITLQENQLQLWDVQTLKPLTPPLSHQQLEFYRLSADRKTLFTAGLKNVRLWDVGQSRLRYTKQVTSEKWIVAADGSPDGSRFVTVVMSDLKLLVGWHTTGNDAEAVFRQRFPMPIVSVEYDPGGRWIVVKTEGGPFEVLDSHTGKDTCSPIDPDPDYNPLSTAPYQAQFDPAGKPRLLIPKNEGYDIVDPANGKLLSMACWSARPADLMRFSAAGTLVAVTTWQSNAPPAHGQALVIDCKTGMVVRRFGDQIRDFQISFDGKWALVNLDGLPPRTELWDLTTGVKVQEFPRAAHGTSLYAAMSPMGSTIAAESEKGITTIWRLRQSSAVAR